MKIIVMCVPYNESSFSRKNKFIEKLTHIVQITFGLVGDY